MITEHVTTVNTNYSDGDLSRVETEVTKDGNLLDILYILMN